MKGSSAMRKFLCAAVILAALTIVFSACDGHGPEIPTEEPTDESRYADGEWAVIKSTYRSGELNAANYFVTLNGAKGDGETDDTAAINATLKKAAQAGGGTVYVPAGTYLITSQIVIPENVTLLGDFISPTSRKPLSEGTMFAVEKTDETLSSPLISISGSGVLEDISVFYKTQSPSDIVKYPYTVMQTSGRKAKIKDVAIINAYKGISFVSPDTEDITVENIYITALDTAISVTTCSDKLTLRNVNTSPIYWINNGLDQTLSDSLKSEMLASLTAIKLYCSADVFASDITIDTAYRGIHVNQPYGSKKSILAANLTTYNAHEGVFVDSCSQNGIAFSFCAFRTTDLSDSASVRFSPSFISTAVFNSCNFPGRPGTCIKSEGHGRISAVNCTFSAWRTAAITSSDISFTSALNTYSSAGRLDVFSDKTVGTFALDSLISPPVNEYGLVFSDVVPNEYNPEELELSMFSADVSAPAIKDRIFKITDFYAENNTDFYPALKKAIDAASEAGGGTVFIPAGTYDMITGIIVKKGVRIQGTGCTADPTVSTVITTAIPSTSIMRLFELESGAAICGITVKCTAESDLTVTEKTDFSQYTGTAFASFSASDIHIEDVLVLNAPKACVFTDCTGVCVKNLHGCTLVAGLDLTNCTDTCLLDITFDTEYASDALIKWQQPQFRAVTVNGGRSIRLSNLSHTNGDYTLRLASDETPVIPDDPTFSACGVFSDTVYATVSVEKFDFAALANIASRPQIFSQNAYHFNAAYGNTGKISVASLLGSGNVTGAWNIRSGEVRLYSCVAASSGSSMLRLSGGEVSVIGSVFLDNTCTYHVHIDSGQAHLLGNIINSTTSFNGTEKSYLRKYADEDSLLEDDLNLKQSD